MKTDIPKLDISIVPSKDNKRVFTVQTFEVDTGKVLSEIQILVMRLTNDKPPI